MTSYDVNVVSGTNKNNRKYEAFQLIVHTNYGDYKSRLIFPTELSPVNKPDFFNSNSDNTSSINSIYSNESSNDDTPEYF